jgi:hypothetical protein
VDRWQRARTRAWVESGTGGCATDLIGELATARERGVVALTLEAAALPPTAPGLRVISAQAGVVPAPALDDPRRAETQRFTAALGPLDWWAALGRDAATLARAAALELPLESVTLARAVVERRAAARDRLASARGRLWSTEASGWTDGRAMHRAICAVDISSIRP